MAWGLDPRMHAGLDALVLDRGFEPRGLLQGAERSAGDQLDGFGLPADAFAPRARALRHERKAGNLGGEAAHHDGAGHRLPIF